MYILAGYDKDNDIYEEIETNDSFEEISAIAEETLESHLEDPICRETSDGDSEPFDWFVIFKDELWGELVLTYTNEFPCGTDIFNDQ